MKRIIIAAVAAVMLVVSAGGCIVPWHNDDRDGRHARDRDHQR